MKQSIKLQLTLLTLSPMLATTIIANTKKQVSTQPNILVVLCDDLGYNDVGFNGSADIKTPQMDDLAKKGTILSSAYVVHPFSGPSRAALMTGRYPHMIGAQYNLPANSEIIGKGVPVHERFISNELQDAGYITGIVGKWHLGALPQYHPNKRGFDDFYGFLGGGHNFFPEQYLAAYDRQKAAGQKVIFEYLLPLEHNGKEVREKEYLTDALSNEAIRFVKESSDKNKPFFLYLSYNAPHVPLEAKKEDMEVFSYIKDKDRRTYAAMVYAVDRGVGEIVKALKANNQYENTLIVFFSDNGGNVDHGASNFPLKGTKGDTWEGGYRTPMFFHWPNVVPAGRVYEFPITALDFYPTFVGLAGAKLPSCKKVDGKDIWKSFIAGTNAREGEMIYSVRYRYGYCDVGARKDDWKITRTGNEPWQLFNIKEDLGEKNNMGYRYPERMQEMINETEVWTRNHIEPLWFHSEDEKRVYKKTKMPNYEETFRMD